MKTYKDRLYVLVAHFQVLLELVVEWNHSAPLAFHLPSQVLLDLLLKWRRLQRKGWQALLSGRQNDYA